MVYRNIFFDLDNTVTRSRSLLAPPMQEVLVRLLRAGFTLSVVSGARVEQAKKQLSNFPCFYLGQNGNHAHDGNTGRNLWQRTLTLGEKAEIIRHINSIPLVWSVSDKNDLIQDRGCQISYSLIGHNEVLEKKEAFDPDGLTRKSILEKFPLVSGTVEAKLGGTTCFDYNQKGKHKGYNIAEFVKRMNWDKKKCLYIGDALFPGGNDDSVVGVIETQSVKNPDETLIFLTQLLGE